MPILPDDNVHFHRKMLLPQRCWPLRNARHVYGHEMHTRDAVTERTDRVARWQETRVIDMRKKLDGFDVQFQIGLPTIRYIDFLRNVASLKWLNSIVDRLEPAESTGVPKG